MSPIAPLEERRPLEFARTTTKAGAVGSWSPTLYARPGAAEGLEGWPGARSSGRALVVVAPALFLGKMPIVDLLENDPDPINHDGADDRYAE